MRDTFFLLILAILLYLMAKRPFVAVGLWIWTAMFYPNGWLYGFASGFRYNLVFTAVAILGYVALRQKPKVSFGTLGGLILLFFAWTTISTVLTSGLAETTWDFWVRFFKVILLFVFVVLVINKKLHVDFFLWCVVLSIGFFGGLEALKYVASGGGHKIEGFYGHVLGDRNELAVAFVMTLPVCAYLLGEYGKQSKLLRLGLFGLMGLIVAAIVGTQSRGGFVALLGLAAYLFMKSDRKFALGIAFVVLAGAMSYLVSDEWSSRMNTINEASGDASFMGRVVAWKMSFILAAKNPFFGAGFKSLENLAVWRGLAADFLAFPFFYSGDLLPNPNYPRAAHSVYFQVLGDHGFAGLGIYLAVLIRAFLVARSIAREARKHVETHWIANFAIMAQLCLFGFCLGGAALSFAYFELMFALCGLILVVEKRILPATLVQIPALAASPSLKK
ncbi:MAG: putative O-glycosylation ligase, exosortase A system-associated [Pseudomonadota bacterium]